MLSISRARLSKWLFVAALLLAPQLASADSEGPFVGLSGTWRGVGHVVTAEGNTERIACKATYNVSPDGINMAQTLVCASDSYRFDIHTDIFTDGQALRGTWKEMTRNATGNLSGEIHDGLIHCSVSAPGFTADISVRTVGRKQTVSINPQGKDIAKVDIVLTPAR